MRLASPIHGKTCGISSRDTQRGGNGLPTKKRGFRNRFRKSRSGLEEHQPRARETKTEKGIDATTVEQLLKQMENLKIVMVKKSDDRPTSSKYMDRRCIWCDSTKHDRRDCNDHKRRYDGILFTTREIRFIRWTLKSHSDRTSGKEA